MRRQGSFWERRSVAGMVGLVVLLAATIYTFTGTNVGAQAEDEESVLLGESTFLQICAACHTIGAGVLVGPDLQGVTERREDEWLKVQIQSPSIHHEENDPIAVANREEFGMRMPDLGLTDQQVEAVIAYLGAEEPTPVAIPSLYVPTLAIGILGIIVLTLIGLIVGTKKVEVRL